MAQYLKNMDNKYTIIKFYGITPRKFVELLKELENIEESIGGPGFEPLEILTGLGYIVWKNNKGCLRDLLIESKRSKIK